MSEKLESISLIPKDEMSLVELDQVVAARYERLKDNILTITALGLVAIITLVAAAAVFVGADKSSLSTWGLETLRLVLVGALSFIWGAKSKNSDGR